MIQADPTISCIIIAGYSDHGHRIKEAVMEAGYKGELYFCDNSTEKQTLLLGNARVMGVKDASEQYRDALWIIAVQQARDAVIKQLQSYGIHEHSIVRYWYRKEVV